MSLAIIVCSACSTKNYGRQPELTDFEKRTMTCREIDLEQAKVEGFLQHVYDESQFDGRSVLSFLGDFGIGNMMEKDSAVDSANQRRVELDKARMGQGCLYASVSPSKAYSAQPATTNSSDAVEQQLYELQQQKGLSYQEYQRRYKEITGGK
ncbi:hypothetical protein QN386_10435 [Pseudomonas sp. CCI3.2]|uniref:hypothetical protein n=1 Tax=unclassified Pseudomonas TaxID=196821 RepID=UPI002AC8B950|nr:MULTISPECIES: hypothetical protein [unclassified Pseudomonas]MEB0078282.1 hypothetical protein [Pseudomonas sp. MH10out]MEB0101736.1 hypothetical protein [Pseudomonas sp. CCI3.2]MEB0160185.1 hypothetical protein [Pseudomonas sp. AH2 (2023)]MEB0168015.1 hypothetical protein [Pseudomonas sp. CCC4.4]WPX28847.1 hypothetical protein RHM64_04095 [Pseudomonas sp. AH2]